MMLGEREKKLLVYAAIGVVGVWGISKMIRAIKSGRTQRELAAANQYNASNLTINDAQASMLAENLHNAMASIGTDTATIRTVMAKLVTPDDWKLVIVKFGVRPYGYFGSPTFGSGTPLSLIDWFRNECSGSLMSEIEQKWVEYGLTGIR